MPSTIFGSENSQSISPSSQCEVAAQVTGLRVIYTLLLFGIALLKKKIKRAHNLY